MFYCQECAKRNKWPEGLRKSLGPCEVCGHTRDCWDVPSSALSGDFEKPASEKLIRAECHSSLSIERNGSEMTLTLKVDGLPDFVISHIIASGEKLDRPIIGAIFSTITNGHMKEENVYSHDAPVVH